MSLYPEGTTPSTGDNELRTQHKILEALTGSGGAVLATNGVTDEELRATALTVTSGGYLASVTITRPSNTTDYTAGDVIGVADSGTPANAGSAIHTLTNIGPSGGFILLTDLDLRIDLTTVTSGMTSFRLHLYNAAPDAVLDNASWNLSSAGDRGKYIGYVDMGTIGDLGSTLFVQSLNNNREIKLATGSTSLFGVLVTNGGYTPASGTVYTLRAKSVGI